MGFRKFLLHSCFSIVPPYWDFDFYTAFEKGVKMRKISQNARIRVDNKYMLLYNNGNRTRHA